MLTSTLFDFSHTSTSRHFHLIIWPLQDTYLSMSLIVAWLAQTVTILTQSLFAVNDSLFAVSPARFVRLLALCLNFGDLISLSNPSPIISSSTTRLTMLIQHFTWLIHLFLFSAQVFTFRSNHLLHHPQIEKTVTTSYTMDYYYQ